VQSEHVGIAHTAFADALTQDPRLGVDRVRDAHRALVDLDGAGQTADADALSAYVTVARPRHLLLSGNPGAPLAAIQESIGPRAADSRDQWATWLPLFEDELGLDHPDTLTARSNVAYWRGDAGDAAGAAAAFEELLGDYLRVLGPDHPDTLKTRHDIAYWRGTAGDSAGAAAASQELLAGFVRVLGPDHPLTLKTRQSIARWCGMAGDPAGTVAALDELLVDRLRVLGPDHPDTLSSRHGVAYWRGVAGDPSGAAAAMEELLVDRARVLGPGPPLHLEDPAQHRPLAV